MTPRAWGKTQIGGLLFIAVGLMNLLTEDILLGVVWALLGISLIAYVPGRDASAPRRFEPSPRNLLALVAVLIALGVLVIQFAGLLD